MKYARIATSVVEGIEHCHEYGTFFLMTHSWMQVIRPETSTPCIPHINIQVFLKILYLQATSKLCKILQHIICLIYLCQFSLFVLLACVYVRIYTENSWLRFNELIHAVSESYAGCHLKVTTYSSLKIKHLPRKYMHINKENFFLYNVATQTDFYWDVTLVSQFSLFSLINVCIQGHTYFTCGYFYCVRDVYACSFYIAMQILEVTDVEIDSPCNILLQVRLSYNFIYPDINSF